MIRRTPHDKIRRPLDNRLPRAGVADFAALPERIDTRFVGLLLAVPDLVAFDVGGGVPKLHQPL